jgi:hypothetical protein
VKKHALWLALAVTAFVVVTAYLLRRKPSIETPPPPREVTAQPPSASPYSPPPNQAAPPKPKPLVPIEDGKTIDFSSGNPVVKDSAAEKAIIEKSVKDMEAALRNVTFTLPPPAPAAPPKKTDGK